MRVTNYIECCLMQLKKQSMRLMKIRFISIILKIIFDRRWGEELQISEKITEFNGKVINDIQMNIIRFNLIQIKSETKLCLFIHCFEFSNNLVKAR